MWGSQPIGQPKPSPPRSGPHVNDEGPSCRHTSILHSPTKRSPLPATQAREVTTRKVDCPDREALEAGLGLLGHRFLGPGTPKGRGGQGRLWMGMFFVPWNYHVVKDVFRG